MKKNIIDMITLNLAFVKKEDKKKLCEIKDKQNK